MSSDLLKNPVADEFDLNTDFNEDIEKSKCSDELPVSKLERWAFYSYGFASEPYSATLIVAIIPIILETLASESALQSDLLTRCDTTSHDYACFVYFLGSYMDTSSFTLYTHAIAVAIQALVFISMSAVADYGSLRKFLLLFTGVIGAISSILFICITRYDQYWVAALLTIISNVAFGASYVFYYAYVPTLTTNDPQVLKAVHENDPNVLKIREAVANDLSGKGFAWGYFGAVITLIASAGIVLGLDRKGPISTFPLQVCCVLCGVWWLLFMIVTWKYLVNRPGKPLPEGESYLIYSWKKLFITLSHLNKLSHAFKFLLSWFIMSDAVSTLVSVAVLFAKKSLGFTRFELLLGALIVPLSAFVGCFMWNYIRARFNLATKTMIIIITLLFIFLTSYSLIGLANVGFGLKTKPELFAFSVYHGLLIGSIQSFYRVMFSEMLPAGKENEFFGLYEITDKGSSWVGPLVVGAITNATGNIRYGFIFILASMVISLGIILLVDNDKGIEQARQFEIDEKNGFH